MSSSRREGGGEGGATTPATGEIAPSPPSPTHAVDVSGEGIAGGGSSGGAAGAATTTSSVLDGVHSWQESRRRSTSQAGEGRGGGSNPAASNDGGEDEKGNEKDRDAETKKRLNRGSHNENATSTNTTTNFVAGMALGTHDLVRNAVASIFGGSGGGVGGGVGAGQRQAHKHDDDKAARSSPLPSNTENEKRLVQQEKRTKNTPAATSPGGNIAADAGAGSGGDATPNPVAGGLLRRNERYTAPQTIGAVSVNPQNGQRLNDGGDDLIDNLTTSGGTATATDNGNDEPYKVLEATRVVDDDHQQESRSSQQINEAQLMNRIESGVQDYIENNTIRAHKVESVDEKHAATKPLRRRKQIICFGLIFAILAIMVGIGIAFGRNNGDGSGGDGNSSNSIDDDGVQPLPNPKLTRNAPLYNGYDVADPHGGYFDLGIASGGCQLCRWDGTQNAPTWDDKDDDVANTNNTTISPFNNNFTFPNPTLTGIIRYEYEPSTAASANQGDGDANTTGTTSIYTYYWSCSKVELEEWPPAVVDVDGDVPDSSSLLSMSTARECYESPHLSTNDEMNDLWGYYTYDKGEYLIQDEEERGVMKGHDNILTSAATTRSSGSNSNGASSDMDGVILYCAWIGNCPIEDFNERPAKNQLYYGVNCTQPSWWSCRQGTPDPDDEKKPQVTYFHTGIGYWNDKPPEFWSRRYNPQLTRYRSKHGGYDWADQYGGFYDLGEGNGCELCRWEGFKSVDLPGYEITIFQFPNPTKQVTLDEYFWSCTTTRISNTWPPLPTSNFGTSGIAAIQRQQREPEPCYITPPYSPNHGFRGPTNGQYQVEDAILQCYWGGDCLVDWIDNPPKNQTYDWFGNCRLPSFWICNVGPNDAVKAPNDHDPSREFSLFGTGLGYWDDKRTDEEWIKLNAQLDRWAYGPQPHKGYELADPYAGWWYFGSHECELCRWDGPQDAPSYPFRFPDPRETLTYGDYSWACQRSQRDVTKENDWPYDNKVNSPQKCHGSTDSYDPNWGWPTSDNSLYIIDSDQDNIVAAVTQCGWVGNCEVTDTSVGLLSKSEPYFGPTGTECSEPSWWSCRTGNSERTTAFHTGLGYWNQWNKTDKVDTWPQYEGVSFAFGHKREEWCADPSGNAGAVMAVYEGVPCPNNSSQILWMRFTTINAATQEVVIKPNGYLCTWERTYRGNWDFWRVPYFGECGIAPERFNVPTEMDDARLSKYPNGWHFTQDYVPQDSFPGPVIPNGWVYK